MMTIINLVTSMGASASMTILDRSLTCFDPPFVGTQLPCLSFFSTAHEYFLLLLT
jgi:hypothetical protein